MADVARRAGVSTAAVSMSLRDLPNIAEATRKRINLLAAQMGYQPNPYVSALMQSRRRGRAVAGRPVLAVVCGLEHPDAWRASPSLTRRATLAGALERARELGYDGQEFWLHQDGMTPQRFSAMLKARGIRGILLGPLPDGATPPALQWENFSAVTLGVPLSALPLPSVCNDHYFSSQHAIHQSYALGYRAPALIFRRSHRQLFQGRWEAGFHSAQRVLPELRRIAPFIAENLEDAAAFPLEQFSRWLKANRPDVVVTMAWELTERMLGKLGIKVPRDIGLVGLSCPKLGHRVSGIFQNGHLIGATGMEQLINRVERHSLGLPTQAVTLMIEGLWNPGSTIIRRN